MEQGGPSPCRTSCCYTVGGIHSQGVGAGLLGKCGVTGMRHTLEEYLVASENVP